MLLLMHFRYLYDCELCGLNHPYAEKVGVTNFAKKSQVPQNAPPCDKHRLHPHTDVPSDDIQPLL